MKLAYTSGSALRIASEEKLRRDLEAKATPVSVLQTEEDIVMMMNALLDLLALMPIVPAYIAKYLPEIFEVFRFVSH